MAAAEAAATLGELTLQPETVVPALVQALQRSDDTTRIWALSALGDYGAQAKPALPLLLAELRTEDWFVRQYVVMALERIAPAALANIPPQ